eukprot:1082716-Rhodomonas_salina.3
MSRHGSTNRCERQTDASPDTAAEAHAHLEAAGAEAGAEAAETEMHVKPRQTRMVQSETGCVRGRQTETGRRILSDTGADAYAHAYADADAEIKQQSSSQLAEAAGNVKGTNVDDHLATLIVKLQLLSQGAGKAIDDSSRSLLAELPHAMVEIER